MAESVPRNELISDLRRVADDLDKSPTAEDIRQHSDYSITPYYRVFDSVKEARKAAGLSKPRRANKVPRDDLLADLKRVANELGQSPTTEEYDAHGRFHHDTIRKRFGGWNNAKDEAGLEYRARRPEAGENHPRWQGGYETEVDCHICGETITRKPHHVKQYDASICGPECMAVYVSETFRGDNHPNWQGGKANYYGANWISQRQKAIERDNEACRLCGMTADKHQENYRHGLHVHHIRRIGSFDTPEDANYLDNLITLCISCHNKWEGIPLTPS